MKWFKKGDRNTKLFYNFVRGRRKRLHINEIENNQGIVLKDTVSIGEEVVKVLEAQFKDMNANEDFSMLNYIPMLITQK